MDTNELLEQAKKDRKGDFLTYEYYKKKYWEIVEYGITSEAHRNYEIFLLELAKVLKI